MFFVGCLTLGSLNEFVRALGDHKLHDGCGDVLTHAGRWSLAREGVEHRTKRWKGVTV